MPSAFAHDLITFQAPWDCELKMHVGDPYIGHARAILNGGFLRSTCTHLMFIDNDLQPREGTVLADHIKRLLSHDKDIVAGFYAKKNQKEGGWCCDALVDQKEADETGLMEVNYMGTGFMLIKRGVLEHMREAYGKELHFVNEQDGLDYWDFFSTGVHQPSRRWLSEDWWFCQRARDLGYIIYGDARLIMLHMGYALYPLEQNRNNRADAD